ncbi:THO complex, subunit THOC1 [Lipomyces oligophaga]|uniref:THO complex, subunit THOC1 n=1 Tax=Lipomyces oligophaga TaxID=45792 RepID=UPI0034CDF23A
MNLDNEDSKNLIGIIDAVEVCDDCLIRPLESNLKLAESMLTFVSSLDGRPLTSVLDLQGKLLLYSYAALEDGDFKTRKLTVLLDMLWLFHREGHSEIRLVYEFLETLLETQTIDWCEFFWPFVEARESRLASDLNGARKPGLDLIRMCNALLKRLSKLQYPKFSGRILTFLGKAFPLSERSGVNQRGDFNTENITTWDRDQDPESVYSRFWSLQPFFADPVRLISDSECQEKFKDSVLFVLQHLKDYSSKGSINVRTSSSKFSSSSQDFDDLVSFVPKWLTGYSLFGLELNDPVFRRTFYSQLYILCNFLLANSDSSTVVQDTAPNRSVIYNKITSSEFIDFLKMLQEKILAQNLKSVDLDPQFLKSLKIVVNRDQNWQDWKRANTPSFEKPKLTQSDIDSCAQNISKHKGLKRSYMFAMGTPALSRLNKTPTGLGLLANSDRYTIPDPEKFKQKIEVELINSEGENLEINAEFISSCEWRALRATRARGIYIDTQSAE